MFCGHLNFSFVPYTAIVKFFGLSNFDVNVSRDDSGDHLTAHMLISLSTIIHPQERSPKLGTHNAQITVSVLLFCYEGKWK